jgi:protein arginine kinase activator
MKCQHCEKPATFHITEVLGAGGPQVMHLCEEHAKIFLTQGNPGPTASVAGALVKQLKLGASSATAETDQKECPVCGISFFEFRNSGRLGCPYDYTHFQAELEPLLSNIHDGIAHVGKKPLRAAVSADSQAELIQLRRQMEEAVEREDYEKASEIRDAIKKLENDHREEIV